MTAVCTDQQSAEHIPLTVFGLAFPDFPTLLLNLLPNRTVNDRFVNIFENNHILRIVLNTFFILIRFGICFEVDYITTIFLRCQNFYYRRIVPLVCRKIAAFSGLLDAFFESNTHEG